MAAVKHCQSVYSFLHKLTERVVELYVFDITIRGADDFVDLRILLQGWMLRLDSITVPSIAEPDRITGLCVQAGISKAGEDVGAGRLFVSQTRRLLPRMRQQ